MCSEKGCKRSNRPFCRCAVDWPITPGRAQTDPNGDVSDRVGLFTLSIIHTRRRLAISGHLDKCYTLCFAIHSPQIQRGLLALT